MEKIKLSRDLEVNIKEWIGLSPDEILEKIPEDRYVIWEDNTRWDVGKLTVASNIRQLIEKRFGGWEGAENREWSKEPAQEEFIYEVNDDDYSYLIFKDGKWCHLFSGQEVKYPPTQYR